MSATSIHLDAVAARAAFLAERRKGIGGSDCGAIVGLDPRRTRYGLWREKRGLPDNDDGKPAARRRGNYLEAAILRRYAEVVKPASMEPGIAHAANEGGWRRGNQDARAVLVEGKRVAVECKSVNRNVLQHTQDPNQQWGQPWSDEVPQRHLCQGLWYANLDDADLIDFPVLVMPDDPDEVLGLTADEVVAVSEFRVYRAMRNRDVEAWLIDEARKFWFDHVVANVAPELELGTGDVDLRWPISVPKTAKPLDDEKLLVIARRFHRVSEARNKLTKLREHLREHLQLFAEGAEALTDPRHPNTPWVTLKTQKRAGYPMPPTTSLVVQTTKWFARAHRSTQTLEN